MVILRNKAFSKSKKKLSREDKEDLGAGAIGLGTIGTTYGVANALQDTNGEITGRLKRYHSTAAKDKILEEGLDGAKTLDPQSFTNRATGGAATKAGKPLVYVAIDKNGADGVGYTRDRTNLYRTKSKTVQLNIPYDDVKNRRILENPEIVEHGGKEKFIKDLQGGFFPKTKEQAEEIVKALDATDAGGTRIYEGKISPKYIKESPKYEANSLKEWARYVKNNPKRFAKGVGKKALPIVGGVGLIGTGAVLMSKKKKKDKKED